MAAVAPQASTSTASLSTSSAADALKALTFQRLHPKTYLERFLAENVRPDGRDLDEWRDVSVNVGACPAAPALRPLSPPPPLSPSPRPLASGRSDTATRRAGSISTADGSALVRLGQTTVVCGVKAELAEPELDRPNEGFLGACSPPCARARTPPHPPLPTRELLASFVCFYARTVPNLDLPAICSPKFKPGPPTDEAQVLSDRLNEVLVS